MQSERQHSKLREKTLQLLRNRKKDVTLDHISHQTKITTKWLRDFGQDRIPNPGVCLIETLYNHLSPTPLDIK